MFASKSTVRLTIVIAGLLCASACRDPQCGSQLCVYVTGDNPPTFSFKPTLFSEAPFLGGFFYVNEIQRDDAGQEVRTVIWQIEADAPHEDLPRIRYGELPTGFRQVVPSDGKAPPELVENRTYLANGPPAGIGYTGTYFIIVHGNSHVLKDR